jgi:hypothetical protein
MPRNPKPKCRKCKRRPVPKRGQLCTVCKKPKAKSQSNSRARTTGRAAEVLGRSFPIASPSYYADQARRRTEKIALLRQLEPHAIPTERLIHLARDPEIGSGTQCVALCIIALRQNQPLPKLPALAELQDHLDYIQNRIAVHAEVPAKT